MNFRLALQAALRPGGSHLLCQSTSTLTDPGPPNSPPHLSLSLSCGVCDAIPILMPQLSRGHSSGSQLSCL